MFILVLDELDQACKKTNETVAEIFSFCSLPHSKLVVISIANRLDLATRVLQPAGLAHTAAPYVVPFHSYTARQLMELLEVSAIICNL
jgi:Cdc6-like AAA superfamily ATPase